MGLLEHKIIETMATVVTEEMKKRPTVTWLELTEFIDNEVPASYYVKGMIRTKVWNALVMQFN